MSELTSLNIKIPRSVKAEGEALFNSLGMTLTTAINIFVRQSIKEQALPFPVRETGKQPVTAQQATEDFRIALKEMQDEAVRNGTSTMTLEEINAEIALARKERREYRASQ